MKGSVHFIASSRAARGGLGVLALTILTTATARAQDSAAATPPATPAAAPPATPAATPAATGDTSTTNYRTHTVRAGETLFDIAQAYLGDGNLWPEIYRLNSAAIEDPHWIYTKEVLRIPPAPGQTAAAPTPAPAAAASPLTPPDASASGAASATTAATTEPAPADQTTAAAPTETADEETPVATGTTLFSHPPQREAMVASARVMSMGAPRAGLHPDVRLGAPFLDRDNGPRGAGAVVGSVDLSNVVDAANRAHYDLDDNVYVTMPRGTSATVGERFYTFTLGTSFGERGQVVVPTGIVTIVQAGSGKEALVGRVTTLFGEMSRWQGVLAVDETPSPTAQPAHVDDGVRSHVLWVEDQVVLPTQQYYVIIGASEKQGLHVGDLISLYRPRAYLPEADATLPENPIATAQVVRVNGYATTAILTGQIQPAIEAGTAVRVVAAMP